MNMKAIVFGASGMVGEGVLLTSLRSPHVESVLVIGRRACNVDHPKMTEILRKDFFDFADIESKLTGYDACFFCLGVSSVGMNEADYTRTTYDLTMHAARTLSRLNPGMTFCYVSGTGTDSTEKGRLMWARVKGRTENHLAQLPFKAAYAFRPGLMKPVEGQKNLKSIFRLVGKTYPLWKFLAPKHVCTLEELGLAMIQVSRVGTPQKVLENPDIARLAKTP
jgi:uncharacterized protein YbjT (DUF2867 family)